MYFYKTLLLTFIKSQPHNCFMYHRNMYISILYTLKPNSRIVKMFLSLNIWFTICMKLLELCICGVKMLIIILHYKDIAYRYSCA